MSGQLSLSDFLKIEDAAFRARSHGLQGWDARLKVGLFALLVLVNVYFAVAELSGAILGLALLGMAWSRTPLKPLLLFVLAPMWGLVIVMVGFSVGFGHTPVTEIGPLTVYLEGIQMGGNAVLRVAAEMAWAALLVLTTPFTSILAALRWYRVPEVLVSTLGYMYRYVFMLFEEFSTMKSAARVRGGFQGRFSGIRTTGLIAAQILLRAYDRGGRVAQAIQARGGD